MICFKTGNGRTSFLSQSLDQFFSGPSGCPQIRKY